MYLSLAVTDINILQFRYHDSAKSANSQAYFAADRIDDVHRSVRLSVSRLNFTRLRKS